MNQLLFGFSKRLFRVKLNVQIVGKSRKGFPCEFDLVFFSLSLCTHFKNKSYNKRVSRSSGMYTWSVTQLEMRVFCKCLLFLGAMVVLLRISGLCFIFFLLSKVMIICKIGTYVSVIFENLTKMWPKKHSLKTLKIVNQKYLMLPNPKFILHYPYQCCCVDPFLPLTIA